MRLWHKQLIDVLPDNQLRGQWRECCAIAKAIAENGTPNHILVNRIMDYPIEDFWSYGLYIYHEMIRRGYKCDWGKFGTWFSDKYICIVQKDLFSEWHNDRYLFQCYRNLEEKHDCGGIADNEWGKIVDRVYMLTARGDMDV